MRIVRGISAEPCSEVRNKLDESCRVLRSNCINMRVCSPSKALTTYQSGPYKVRSSLSVCYCYLVQSPNSEDLNKLIKENPMKESLFYCYYLLEALLAA